MVSESDASHSGLFLLNNRVNHKFIKEYFNKSQRI